jgi:hypothetical protein
MTSQTEWPPELDALIADPQHHELLFENDKVRVLRVRIAPGDRTPVHTHRWAGPLYILSWSSFIRRDDQGNVLVDSRAVPSLQSPGPVLWGAPLPPHSFENIGQTDVDLIAVELKDS